MKTATTEVQVSDVWSTRESHAAGYVFAAEPYRSTQLEIEVMTIADPDYKNVVWLRVERDSNLAAEGWHKRANTQIVLLADEVDALIATLQTAVAEARKSGVLAAVEVA